jgi:hypothetical protein
MHLVLCRRDFAQIEVINAHFSIPGGPLAALMAIWPARKPPVGQNTADGTT